ncbi:MAG: D-ornithine 4,5-aminomutase subunit OraS [Mobilicoccus sp.]|nr:D-ornithine 4,5-aminomutase subunit OraS [Mobilicoccus sp.]
MTDHAPLTPAPGAGPDTPEPQAPDTLGGVDRTEKMSARVEELSALTDEELKERFWELSRAMMTPVVDLARTHTSPSIERSILLRMGIDSVSSHGVVDAITEAGLLGKGAGHVVLRVGHVHGLDVREAAARIAEDPSVLADLFAGK